MKLNNLLRFTSLFISVCSGRLYHDPSEILHLDAYDYVVVGGGVAGCVLANRLTEDNNISVLLLEAGPSHQGVFAIEVPGLQSFTGAGTIYNWNYTSVLQANLMNQRLPAPRGHVLGGSSSINGMWYTRGSSADYDRWANTTGDIGWSWDQMQAYFKKSERFVTPADNHNISGQYNPALHGEQGPLDVSLPGYNQSLDQLVTRRLDESFPFIEDYQNGEPLGFGWTQTTIGSGARSSAASAYLDQYLNRSNLDIVVNTRVTRVLASSGIHVDTVEFIRDTETAGVRMRVQPKIDILLAAGVFNTPQILLNSGIGDASFLSMLNIEVMHDLPSVGKNLTEQPAIANLWTTNGTVVADPVTAFNKAVAQWNNSKTGRLVMATGNNVGWIRMNMSDPAVNALVEQYGDPAPGPKSPHIELLPSISAFGAVQNFANAEFVLDSVVLTPQSRGTVTLNSSNPFGPPMIDYRFYTEPQDIEIMRQGVRTALDFVSTPSWQEFLTAPVSPLLAAVIDEYNSDSRDNTAMDAYIYASTSVSFHPVGSCAMSPEGSDWGVVNPDFIVKGLNGLRIVDASVMPFVPAGHCQAAVYAVAERAADIIKKQALVR
ncbi:hypothetical protein GYMLUDRAFT_263606 [Collybiopsis luxurians FD-317 M1]|uniref:Unplaced genomic scaffold GYMLUscaffold_49, whole genome shotgun sequence n=1 Tax=Collybiopsis luxurians FD-317 M1 TaxID=944289 RepID=A0A0D0B0E4_9AGAR|nr:hypothetical protein GYMLUDRAFT_263606 [Collybiopsis luxurians FD-317 M1]